MPYLICSTCHLTTYSRALWRATEQCPRCGVALERHRRDDDHGTARVIPLSRHPHYRAGALPGEDWLDPSG